MDFLSPVWLWMYVGAFLMLAELVLPGFVMFFFGLAAVTVSLFKWLFPALPTWAQLAAFSVFSIVYILVLRRYLKKVFKGDTEQTASIQNEFLGRIGRVVEIVRPDVPGRIMLGDAEWMATSAMRLDVGTEVKVVSQNNLTLRVEPI